MASSIQSNPTYYSVSSGQKPQPRTVVIHKRPDHSGFGVFIGEDVPVGLYVITVERNSPAADANIQPGDRVIAVNGQSVSSMSGNPKDAVLNAATNAESLTLTLQSSNLMDTLDTPFTYSDKDNDTHTQQRYSPKQTLPLNTDLEK
jgi:C-terminal processing protease CtpA/Prc